MRIGALEIEIGFVLLVNLVDEKGFDSTSPQREETAMNAGASERKDRGPYGRKTGVPLFCVGWTLGTRLSGRLFQPASSGPSLREPFLGYVSNGASHETDDEQQPQAERRH